MPRSPSSFNIVLEVLRQEIDGLQGEQLESVPCGPILQDEEYRIIGEAEPAQIRDKKTHIPHSQGQEDLPD